MESMKVASGHASFCAVLSCHPARDVYCMHIDHDIWYSCATGDWRESSFLTIRIRSTISAIAWPELNAHWLV